MCCPSLCGLDLVSHRAAGLDVKIDLRRNLARRRPHRRRRLGPRCLGQYCSHDDIEIITFKYVQYFGDVHFLLEFISTPAV